MEEKTDLSPTTEPTAEILEPEACLVDGIDSHDTGTSAGTSDAIDPEKETEDTGVGAEIEPTSSGGDDTNALISELNDVSMSTANTDTGDTDTLLESLTSENNSGEPETEAVPSVPQLEESNVTESKDKDTNLPNLAVPVEETLDPDVIAPTENISPPSDDNLAPNEEKPMEVEEKDPVRTLEEELERMHEDEHVSPVLVAESVKEAVEKNMEDKPATEMKPKDKIDAPIMRDSDLEEMLSADEVLQDPLTIKAAQLDMKHVDVIVCGRCHEVFTFVDELLDHKKNCTQKSDIISSCEFESKPQVWAFTLWKNSQLKSKEGPNQNPWNIYKKWCTLADSDKNAWISAGQTLQYCHKIGNSKLTEVKVQKIVTDDDKDPLALDGFAESNKENSTFETAKSPLLEVKRTVINKPKAVPTSPKINDLNTNRAMRTVQSAQKKSEYAVERIVAKRFNPKKKTWEYQIKWEHFSRKSFLSEENTWEPLANLNHCKQMVDEFEEQLKKLKAEKAKQQAATVAKNSPKVKQVIPPTPSPSVVNKMMTPNRPQRTSKQKAMDQVKAWCGNISDEDNPTTGTKRGRSPDSDESFEKRMKFDENSDDSEPEVRPKMQYRKIAPKPITQQHSAPIQIIKNGLGKNAPLPQNILIPDANGVVRINQKQLPSLSTGVYIMSKTAGIIKLDSNTSKVATSGGQTIVKVAPKIGQTQIKIMKKDGTSTQQIVQMSPKGFQNTPKAMKTHLARAKKIVSDIKPPQLMKKPTEVIKKPIIVTQKEVEKKMVVKKIPDPAKKSQNIARVKEIVKDLHHQSLSSDTTKDDESDDGLEELPFPDEIKIPEPDENEDAEFTLDPSTGKIAGVEYPDVPDPEPIEETKSDSSLDNIVKLAAADITEDDLKSEPQDAIDVEIHDVGMDEDDEMEQKVKMPIKPEPPREPPKRFVASPMRQVVKMSVTPRKVAANPASILNKALTGPQVVRRSVVGPPSAQRVQQRILNQSVARNPQNISPVVRQVNTYVRTKPMAPKPKFNISSESKFVRPMNENSPKNVYTYSRSIVQNSPAQRKIGNTTIRSTSMPAASPQQRQQTKLVRTSTGLVQRVVSPLKKESPLVVRGQPEKIERKIVQTKPKTVISMPSLMGDDDLLLTKHPQVQPQKPKPVAPVMQEVQESQEYHEAEPRAIVAEQSTSEADENVTPEHGTLSPDMSSFTLADNENPIFITGDDGTVYQVAGQNEQGQTILLTQGSDGQQQCLLVTNEVAEAMETGVSDESQAQPEISIPDIRTDVTEPLTVKTDPDTSDQVVAQVVRAEPPSPGGTHKVVVMLPDGNLMVTQVSPEEYASLELE